ncbi:MAG: putative regulator of sigma factor [Frankiales bacterium]|nr:putative regulator of sigma factor [Frankiales bacterium]
MAEQTQATAAQRVRAARRRRGLSREALAHAAGMSYGAIVQVESGRRTDNRIGTVVALANALEVPLDYLLGRHENPHSLLEHQMLPYASDEEFLEAAVPFIDSGVVENEPVLVVTSTRNTRLLRAATDTTAVTFARASTWYRSPPAALAAYQQFVSKHLDSGYHWVRIIGQPIWAERTPGEVRAWTRYEALLTVAFVDMAATIVCPYDLREVQPEICAAAEQTHPFTRTGTELTRNEKFDSPTGLLLTASGNAPVADGRRQPTGS